MQNKCKETKSYCEKIDQYKKEDKLSDMVSAEAKYTKDNDKRLIIFKDLGGLTVLVECDDSEEWYLRWWLARYDYNTALAITKECLDRKLSFSSLKTPEEYYFLERSIYAIYGALANDVKLLKKSN